MPSAPTSKELSNPSTTTESSIDHSNDEGHHIFVQDINREDGLRARLVLAGAFFAFFCSVGYLNAFGVFQTYYKAHFGAQFQSDFKISWIGSFSTFMMFIGAIPAGILTDKLGPRIPLLGGSICVLLGIFMTSLCTKYYQFFLSQSLLMGVGFSFLFCPAIVTQALYYKKNRALAMGITVAGSSTGGVIWPIVLDNFLNHTGIGYGWTIRIVGFIMLPLLASVCLFTRLPARVAREEPTMQETAESTETKAEAPNESPGLKDLTMVLLCIGLGLTFLGFFGPIFYVSSYAVSKGESTTLAFYLISILNGASFLGRVLSGILADRWGPWNLIIISTLFTAIVSFCWTAATGVAGIIIWAMAYGFFSGAILSLQGACAATLVKHKDMGKAIGAVMGSVALTGLFGSPICGQLVEHYGYLAASMFTGSMSLAGGIVITFARLRVERKILVAK